MQVNFVFGNTNPDERDLTLMVLEQFGASNVTTASVEGVTEYSGVSYLDCDMDIVNFLKIILFYNDRQLDQISHMSDVVRDLLVEFRRGPVQK